MGLSGLKVGGTWPDQRCQGMPVCSENARHGGITPIDMVKICDSININYQV